MTFSGSLLQRKRRSSSGGERRSIHFPLLFLFPSLSFAASLYVSPSGNDTTGNGSLASPYQTIQRAASLAVAGDTIYLRSGTYRETVTPANSGTSGNPITYQPYQNESVTISGLDLIGGPWTEEGAGSGLYYATMSNTYFSSSLNQADQVFVNGKMVQQARWPDTTTSSKAYPSGVKPPVDISHPAKSTITACISKTYDSTTKWITWVIEDDHLAPQTDGYYVGAQIYFQPSWEAWSWTIGGVVTAHTGKRLTFRTRGSGQQSPLSQAIEEPPIGSRYYLFNQKKMIDTPWEWWHDTTNGRLYLKGNPSGMTIEAKKRDFAFNLTNRSFITIKNISIFGATLTTDYVTDPTWSTDGAPAPYAPYKSDGTTRWPGRGTDQIAPASNLVLEGLRLEYASHFTDTSGHFFAQWGRTSGLIIAGSDHIVKNCTIRYSAGNGISVNGVRHKILNNRIEDVNYTSTDSSGINTQGAISQDHEIAYNTIRRTGRSGMTPRGFQNSNPNNLVARIHHNDVGECLLQDWDGGTLYTASTDGKFARIDHNLMHDVPHYSGIYLDFCKNFIVDHNVVWNTKSGIQFQGYFDHDASDETYDPLLGDVDNHLCYNNTIAVTNWRNSAFGPHGLSNGVGMNYGTVLQNNVIVTLDPINSLGFEGIRSTYFDDATKTNNLIWDKISGSATDPQFVSAANFDFHLNSNSPAIDNGTPFSTITRDSISVPPFNESTVGAGLDRGAYERGGTDWGAGTLTITSASSVSGRVNSSFSFTVTTTPSASGFSATGLPSGLSINTSTGVISGTPTTAGTSSVSITATRLNLTQTQTLLITIASGSAPQITNSSLSLGCIEGDALSPFTVTADNTPTSFTAEGLPVGLTLNPSTGVISGTPALLTQGTYSAKITATNASGSSWKYWTVTISPQTPPVITSSLISNAGVGSAYAYLIQATHLPTSFSATNLPAGLTLQPSGAITGTPTTAGTYSPVITATNRFGSDSKTLTIQVLSSMAPSAYDGFGSSSGFSTGWIASGGWGAVNQIEANGVFGPLITAGNSTMGSHCSHERTLSTPIDVTTGPVYITGLHLHKAWIHGVNGSNNWEFFSLVSSADGSIGFGERNSNGTVDVNRAKLIRNGGVHADLVALVDGKTYFYLSKLSHSAGTLTVEFWIYDDPAKFPKEMPEGKEDALAYTTAYFSTTGFTITKLALYDEDRTGYGSSPGGFDELRIGRSFESVTPRAAAPVITSAISTEAMANSTFSGYSLTATGTSVTYSASTVPLGMSFNTTTGVLSGTPTTPGTYTITLTANNANGSDSRDFVLIVRDPATYLHQWKKDGSGNWTDATNNWTSPFFPNIISGQVVLGNTATATTPSRTITLDTDATIGSLLAEATLGLTNAGYTISTSTGKSLTFDVDSGNASITNPSGASSLRINTSLILNDPLTVTASSTGDTGAANATASVFLAGNISGTGAITKTGTGTFRLGSSSGQTFSGGFTLAQGPLTLGTPASGTSINALGTGTFTVNNSNTHSIGHNNFKYSASVPVLLANPGVFANPIQLNVNSASTSFLNWNIDAFNSGALKLTGAWSSSAPITSDIILNAGGATGLIYGGNATGLSFSNNGRFWFKTGSHFISAPNALGANNSAPIRLGRDAGGDSVTNESNLYLMSNDSVTAPVLLAATTGSNAANRLRLGTLHDGITSTFSGPITLNQSTSQDSARTVELWCGPAGAASTSQLTFSGIVADGSGVTNLYNLVKFGRGTVIFSGTNTYKGTTTVSDGTLLVNGNSSACNGTLTIQGPVTARSTTWVSGGAAGSSSFVVADATGIVPGMAVTGTNLQPHTYVRSVSGTTINLTMPTQANLGAGTFSFSALAGGTLGGTGTIGGAVTLQSGAKLTFNLSTPAANHDRLDLAGSLAMGTSSTLDIRSVGGAATGTYPLLNAAGGITGTLPTLSLPSGWSATLQISGTQLNLLVNSVGATAQETWRQTYFGTSLNTGTAADNADPDGDGVSNLLEYALGGNPSTASSHPTPTGQTTSNRLSLTFTRSVSDVTYIVETSSDLVHWTAIPFTLPPVGQSVTVQDTIDATSSTRRFIRLRITVP